MPPSSVETAKSKSISSTAYPTNSNIQSSVNITYFCRAHTISINIVVFVIIDSWLYYKLIVDKLNYNNTNVLTYFLFLSFIQTEYRLRARDSTKIVEQLIGSCHQNICVFFFCWNFFFCYRQSTCLISTPRILIH